MKLAARKIVDLNLFPLLILLVILAGCGDEKIRVHNNVKQTREVGVFEVNAETVRAEKERRQPAQVETRMLVTIHNRENEMWFFRVTAAKSAVDETESAWRPFVNEIKFDENEEPVFDLPEGWSQGRSSQFRYATLLPNTQPPVEIVVSRLPQGQDLLDNVNRWRGQLGLKLISENAEEHFKNLQEGDTSVQYYDEVGMAAGGQTSMAPFANRSAPRVIPKFGLKYKVPEDWEVVDDRPSIKKFKAGDGDDVVEVSLTKLPTGVIDWPKTVQMWSNQLDLENPDESAVADMSQEITIADVAAQMVQLDDGETGMSLRGLMFGDGEFNWFAKLTGSKSSVEAQVENFESLVNSFEFE